MIREALAHVEQTSANRVKAELRLAHIPDLAPGQLAYFVHRGDHHGWEPKLFDYPRGPKTVKVESVDQLNTYVGEQAAVVFVDRDALTVTAFLAPPPAPKDDAQLIVDKAVGRDAAAETAAHDYATLDRVVCQLSETQAWTILTEGIRGTPDEIIGLQKLHFGGWNYDLRKEGTEPFDKFCQKRMKKVVMSVKKTINSATATGVDSMGTDVTREALGGEEGANWPDYVYATAKVYERLGLSANVRLLLSFDQAKNAIVLTPVPDDVEAEEERAVGEIEKTLTSPGRRIFRGAPVLAAGGAVRLD